MRRHAQIVFYLVVSVTASYAVAAPGVTVTPNEPWPSLEPGTVVHLAKGSFSGPWVIDVPGVTVEAEGATLRGPDDGSALVLLAPRISVRNLRIENAGSKADLYAPDSGVWMVGCNDCRLEDVTTSGTPGGIRIEDSHDVVLKGLNLRGATDGPGITAFLADGLSLIDGSIRGFLDGVYIERSNGVRIDAMTVLEASRYGLHVMFSEGVDVVATTISGGGVGSAIMYGRNAVLQENHFVNHVGPLAYGLLVHEMSGVKADRNMLANNTVGALIVSTRGLTLEKNEVTDNGTGLIIQRTQSGATSEVQVKRNRFVGNVSDVAVDDATAEVTLSGNGFDRASRLDRDHNGVSDTPFLPTSTFALLQTRQPDISLFARSPGIVLWEAAESRVPSLQMVRLHDPTPYAADHDVSVRMPASGLIAVVSVIGAVLGFVWYAFANKSVRTEVTP